MTENGIKAVTAIKNGIDVDLDEKFSNADIKAISDTFLEVTGNRPPLFWIQMLKDQN